MQPRILLATSILIVCACQAVPPLSVSPQDNGQTGSASGTSTSATGGYACVETECVAQWREWLAKPYHLPSGVEGSDVQLRFAHCWSPPSPCAQTANDRCRAVVAIDGQCYANDPSAGFIEGTAHRCSLSDQEILGQPVSTSAATKPRTGGCGAAGSGVVATTDSGGTRGNSGSGGSGSSRSSGSGGTDFGNWVRDDSGSGASGSGASGSGAAGSGEQPSHADLPPEGACEQTIEEFCAAPSAGYPACIMDWVDANDPAKWCSPNVYVSASGCSSGYNEIDRIAGSGDNELFVIYYYDQASGRLVHISRVPVPSRQNCVAGDRILRNDELGCVMTSSQHSCGP